MDTATALISDCRSYLRRLAFFAAVGEFYLLLGRRFRAQALPETFSPMPVRQCYRNAASLVLAGAAGLTYCEGYAQPSGLIPVHHAWCVDARGRVVDPTWADCGTADYFGIALNTTWLMAQLLERHRWGVLAECVPEACVRNPPDVFVAQAWLPAKARLQVFERRQREWMREMTRQDDAGDDAGLSAP